MGKRTKDNITLGSGEAYIVEFDDGAIPSPEEMCIPSNLLGRIKGGAALTYTEEKYEEKDDLGYVSKIITTSEEVILKLGLITWNGDTLTHLIDRCKVTILEGKRFVSIGGAANSQGKQWIVCFAHKDKNGGNLWVQILGLNTAGLTLTFAADAGTVLEPEFKALPTPDGTLVHIIEELGETD